LKEYQANNYGNLPLSFDTSKVRGYYQRLKNAQKSLNTKVGEKTVEYFLEIFQALKMWPEAIDMCENFHALTGKSAETSELRHHYLSNALLNLPHS
jgi:lipopolysaccharide biosynthesis regulator YciM